MNRIVSEKAKLDEKELPRLTYGRRLYGRPITHLLSLLGGGRKRPFAVEMLAGIQSGHPELMVKRHSHADRDEVHVGMLDHFVRVGKSVRNSEMLGRFVCGFLAARADRRDLELRKRAQGRHVGIASRPLRILAPMMPTRIFSVAMIILP